MSIPMPSSRTSSARAAAAALRAAALAAAASSFDTCAPALSLHSAETNRRRPSTAWILRSALSD